MPASSIIAALALPPGCLVEQRVPKRLLIEQGTPAAGDKRQVQDGLEELMWHAALKPTNIGVPAFRDSTREYLEIAVLVATLRPLAKRIRLVELIHRAIPYPVLLFTQQGGGATVSLAHKRWSQAEAGKVVLEDAVVTTDPITAARPEPPDVAFIASLALTNQPGANLHSLYQGWLARVVARRAASITGQFGPLCEAPGRYEARRAALADHARITADLTSLRSAAAKERQLNRRVQLNLAMRDLETKLQTLAAHL